MHRPVRAGSLDVHGASLRYEQSGSGTPVVLLHAFALDRRMWDSQVDALAQRVRVIRYDLRGFGQSTIGPTPYRHADDLLALLDHLDVDRAFLIGASLGGGAAINAAVMHPGRVLGLVAVDPSLGGFRWSPRQNTAMRAIQARAGQDGVDAARARWLSLPMFRTLAARPEAEVRFRAMVADCLTDNHIAFSFHSQRSARRGSIAVARRAGR